MKVTLLITNYNYGKFLRRCLRSCLNQSMAKSDYEILVVDDYSTDKSRDILQNYEDCENVRIFYNKENLGIGATCRVGLNKALGQYVVRVDSDDYIHEDFIKFLYVFVITNDFEAAACDYYEVDYKENICIFHFIYLVFDKKRVNPTINIY